jgi:D-alanyl-D-alanine carboxypeptidase
MMLVKSANDIAVAVAETVGGSEAGFVAMMNQEAARLGMTSTRYINPNGLPGEGQWTNARDLAVLARAVWLEFPEYRPLFGIPAIQAGKRVLRSPNTLLERYQGANGMKTGFICASGYNVVASASRGGQTMIAVVLGERTAMSRAETAAELLNRGFATWQVVARARQTLDTFSPARRLSAAPADIRDLVCGKGHGGESEDGDISATTTANSALGPRVVTMAPVKVFTGGADPAPRRVADVPLPRPRPRLEATADVAPAFAPAGPVAVDPLDLMAPLPRARP